MSEHYRPSSSTGLEGPAGNPFDQLNDINSPLRSTQRSIGLGSTVSSGSRGGLVVGVMIALAALVAVVVPLVLLLGHHSPSFTTAGASPSAQSAPTSSGSGHANGAQSGAAGRSPAVNPPATRAGSGQSSPVTTVKTSSFQSVITGSTRAYLGSGDVVLGTLTLKQPSNVDWACNHACSGVTLTDSNGRKLPEHSVIATSRAGQFTVPAGSYHDVHLDGGGSSWDVTITPAG